MFLVAGHLVDTYIVRDERLEFTYLLHIRFTKSRQTMK